MRLWRNVEGFKGCKYLVIRRDGSIPKWDWMVFGAQDPAAPAALLAYANKAEELGMDPEYVNDVRAMAESWHEYRFHMGDGDPDASPHRKDNPWIIKAMVTGKLDFVSNLIQWTRDALGWNVDEGGMPTMISNKGFDLLKEIDGN